MHVMNGASILVEKTDLDSLSLNRKVLIDFYYPNGLSNFQEASLLLINDGQDMETLGLSAILADLTDIIRPLICVAIHASTERKMEYGVAGYPDFKGRGALAINYTSFVLTELLPFIKDKFKVDRFADQAFAGFSLGGLMAIDMVWAHPQIFQTAAVFSGSLWWRSVDQTDPSYDDNQHRIIHQRIRKGSFHPGLKFFFQCGNMDENRDRNNNGVIDSIDDTLDLIQELINKGYRLGKDIAYLEIADGLHDVPTWARAMPEFLKWNYLLLRS